eukprot:5223773-Amphidinium_carterae.1
MPRTKLEKELSSEEAANIIKGCQEKFKAGDKKWVKYDEMLKRPVYLYVEQKLQDKKEMVVKLSEEEKVRDCSK